MISNNIMILLGWLVLLASAIYIGLATITTLRLSIAFGGKLGGEFWFFLIIFALFATGVWWFFPFEVAMKIAPVSAA